MNPVVVVHFLAGLLSVGIAIPLIQRKVPMNPWYGMRIPPAFRSEEAWYEINRYGGRLFVVWGLVIALTAIIGAFLPKKDWVLYDLAALVPILGGLITVISKIYRHARQNNFK